MENDYTVTIAGLERHDGEAPYTYVARAKDREAAVAKVTAHFKAEQGTDDVELVEAYQGVPPADAPFHWNDLRS